MRGAIVQSPIRLHGVVFSLKKKERNDFIFIFEEPEGPFNYKNLFIYIDLHMCTKQEYINEQKTYMRLGT